MRIWLWLIFALPYLAVAAKNDCCTEKKRDKKNSVKFDWRRAAELYKMSYQWPSSLFRIKANTETEEMEKPLIDSFIIEETQAETTVEMLDKVEDDSDNVSFYSTQSDFMDDISSSDYSTNHYNSEPGVVVRLKDHFWDLAGRWVKDFVESVLTTRPLPAVDTKITIPVLGEISLALDDLLINKVSMQPLLFVLPVDETSEPSLSITLDRASVQLSGSMAWRQTVWPHLRSAGTFRIVIDKIWATGNVFFALNATNYSNLFISQLKVEIGAVQVRMSDTRLAAIYHGAAQLLQSKICRAIESYVLSNVPEIANRYFQYYWSKYPSVLRPLSKAPELAIQMNLGGKTLLPARVTPSGVIVELDAHSYLDGSMLQFCPFDTHQGPDVDLIPSSMWHVRIDSSVLQCFAWAAWKAHLMDYFMKSPPLPDAILRTNAWAVALPELSRIAPNAPLSVHVFQQTDIAPTIKVDDDCISSKIVLQVDVFILSKPFNETVPALRFKVDGHLEGVLWLNETAFGVHPEYPWMNPPNPPGTTVRLQLRPTRFQLQALLLSSIIGPVHVERLNQLLAIGALALPNLAEEVVDLQWPLPRIPFAGMTWPRLEMVMRPDFIDIYGNIEAFFSEWVRMKSF